MKKIIITSLILGAFFYSTAFSKTSSVALTNLTLDAKNIFTNNTMLYINDIPCTKGNVEITVRLTCLTKAGAAFFYTPTYTIRNGSSGNYTYRYQYDFRELKEQTTCKLTVTTITYPHLAHSSYPTTTVQEYYFEVAPTRFFSWINPANW